jgi:hypothetical protein
MYHVWSKSIEGQCILTKLGTYLIVKRIWNPIDFQGQGSRSPGQIFRWGDTPRFALLEPTIYHTRGELANQYTINTFKLLNILPFWFAYFPFLNSLALRRKSKDWLTQNQDNVSKWGDMSFGGLLFQWASTIKIQLQLRKQTIFKIFLATYQSVQIKFNSEWYLV